MYQSPERGVLLLSSGKQIESKTLAKICGTDEQTINKLLAELEDNGVFSRLENQAIYNRRMYREGKITEARKEAGRLGGIKQKESKKKAKSEQNAETVTVTEYKSFNNNNKDYKEENTVKKKEEKEDKEKEKKEFQLPDYINRETWDGFIEMRKKIKKPLTELAITRLLNKLEKLKEQGENIEKVLEQSIINCWQDVYPVKNKEEKNNGNGKYKDIKTIRAEDL